uniref:Small ribosomal subunit protein uS2 n=1 Tax=Echinococcus granulosus TaxID=6210 RepID=RSSA_ECHGR|nr:RecName: Full=Small ribosomal subunit protein uS2; AltName: Full=40S ribosomal protein SA; AltName: Full=Laminin-binding protein p40; Short=LBP/p40 [Echinococcus granulosus]AAB68315.1 laminin-binding protein [Echinococcus granulosus]
MSGGIEALELKEDDIRLMVAAKVHLGSTNANYQMQQYVYDRNDEGNHIIHLNKTWEKLLLAARAICAIENPADVVIIGGQPTWQRGALKFGHYTGTTSVPGRFTPGAFTNQIQSGFKEPRLLIVCDPKGDHQPVREGSAVNIPVIGFCNTDSPLQCVDIGIPCNNDKYSIALMLWMLAREVRRIWGLDPRSQPGDVIMDLFLMREHVDEPPEGPEGEAQEPPFEQGKFDAAEAEAPEWPAESVSPRCWNAGARFRWCWWQLDSLRCKG